jgi:hypothetical protein
MDKVPRVPLTSKIIKIISYINRHLRLPSNGYTHKPPPALPPAQAKLL